jgi:hypothetical protein
MPDRYNQASSPPLSAGASSYRAYRPQGFSAQNPPQPSQGFGSAMPNHPAAATSAPGHQAYQGTSPVTTSSTRPAQDTPSTSTTSTAATTATKPQPGHPSSTKPAATSSNSSHLPRSRPYQMSNPPHSTDSLPVPQQTVQSPGGHPQTGSNLSVPQDGNRARSISQPSASPAQQELRRLLRPTINF